MLVGRRLLRALGWRVVGERVVLKLKQIERNNGTWSWNCVTGTIVAQNVKQPAPPTVLLLLLDCCCWNKFNSFAWLNVSMIHQSTFECFIAFFFKKIALLRFCAVWCVMETQLLPEDGSDSLLPCFALVLHLTAINPLLPAALRKTASSSSHPPNPPQRQPSLLLLWPLKVRPRPTRHQSDEESNSTLRRGRTLPARVCLSFYIWLSASAASQKLLIKPGA